MNKLLIKCLPFVDIILVAFVYPAAWLLKNIRRAGVQRLPHCKNALIKVGVFPIRRHYYEPQFDNLESIHVFAKNRNLPGIDCSSIHPRKRDVRLGCGPAHGRRCFFQHPHCRR